MAEAAAPGALAVATYGGERSHPVLIGRDHWSGVAGSVSGDEGARHYLQAHRAVEIDCTGLADPVDLDEPPAGSAGVPSRA
jgi:molybdenum cofactor cytidylyltransferase/nicotine blue oxidoreductase